MKEIRDIYGGLLFTYKEEHKNIKDAVEFCVKNKISLQNADLRDASLRDASLRYADLQNADLRDASLRDADLRGADLRSADLRGAYVPLFCKWSFYIRDKKIVIGCKEKTIEQWDKFFESEETYETKRDTNEFKQIQAVYNACKAYLTTLENGKN